MCGPLTYGGSSFAISKNCRQSSYVSEWCPNFEGWFNFRGVYLCLSDRRNLPGGSILWGIIAALTDELKLVTIESWASDAS